MYRLNGCINLNTLLINKIQCIELFYKNALF